MTRPAMAPAILGILVSGMVAATVLAGCGSNQSTADAEVCPAGQTWCPGCAAYGIPGSCGQVCTGAPCPVPDSGTASGSCGQVTTQAACDSRSDCHSVFVDPGTCGCAGAGCCAHFNRCADGGRANCSGPVGCTIATPFCEAPYVVSYANNCFEGCVRQSECAAPAAACPPTPPTNASSCSSPGMTEKKQANGIGPGRELQIRT
jgi:hypothetical protein